MELRAREAWGLGPDEIGIFGISGEKLEGGGWWGCGDKGGTTGLDIGFVCG